MKSEQLKTLFEQQLKPKLATLESARLATLKKKNALAISAAAFFVTVLSDIGSGPLLLMLFAIMSYCIFAFKFSWDRFRGDYKKQIMNTLLSEIDPSLFWQKAECVSQTRFQQSGLFHKKIDSYSGEDLIYGELAGFKVEMSELCVEQIIPRTEGSSLRRPIFEGLFFAAQSAVEYSHYSYILFAESAEATIKEKLFGNPHNTRIGQVVELADSEFSKYFKVISSEQERIRQILTPELMAKLVDYRKQRLGMPLSLSFVGHNIYIAIAEGRELFEPKLDVSVTNFELVQDLFIDLAFFTSLLQELGLNSASND